MPKFAVMVRHKGFVDRYLDKTVAGSLEPDLSGLRFTMDGNEAASYSTMAIAERVANIFTMAARGSTCGGYTFIVCKQVMKPHWKPITS